MQKHLYLFFSLDFSVFLLPLLFDLTLYGFLSVNGIWHRRSLIQRLLLQRIRRKLLVDVHHFVMKKNQFLVAIITRETASYLLHVVMSFSHAYGVTMKLLIIVWTGLSGTHLVSLPIGNFRTFLSFVLLDISQLWLTCLQKIYHPNDVHEMLEDTTALSQLLISLLQQFLHG